MIVTFFKIKLNFNHFILCYFKKVNFRMSERYLEFMPRDFMSMAFKKYKFFDFFLNQKIVVVKPIDNSVTWLDRFKIILFPMLAGRSFL